MNTLKNFMQDTLSEGCVMVLAKKAAVLEEMPVIKVSGSAYSYNVFNELPNAGPRALDEDLGASFVNPTRHTIPMQIISADVKVDRAIVQMDNINNTRALETMASMEAMAQEITGGILYGTGEGVEMEGLDVKLTKGVGKKFTGTITGDVANVDAELELLYEALDYVQDIRTETGCIFVSPKMLRNFNKLVRNANMTMGSIEAFGRSLPAFDGVAIIVDEQVKDTDIFVCRLSENHVALCSVNGVVATDAGLQGVHYVTAVEGLFNVCVKHPRAFAKIVPAGKSK